MVQVMVICCVRHAITHEDEFLASIGIAVLPFWNHQVREELDSVLKAIWFALEERCPKNPSPSSPPFHKRRGELLEAHRTNTGKRISLRRARKANVACCG